jgi:8-oxo-dGTP pyrophosphatase MutT (NUDIX family)
MDLYKNSNLSMHEKLNYPKNVEYQDNLITKPEYNIYRHLSPDNKKQCINCGTYGHTIKLCNSPITSYGIICYTIFNKKLKYLMIQRKNSLTFIEFIRGKYNINNVDYIEYLFSKMTIEERELFKKYNIDELWKLLWNGNISNRLNLEYKDSKIKYKKLIEGYNYKRKTNTIEFINLYKIIDKINIEYPNVIETEWELPKGRRNLNESDIDCALREFEEESGINKKKILLCNIIKKPIEEIYISNNKIRYKHVYYIAKHNYPIKETTKLFNKENIMQSKEVKDVKWLSFEDISNKITYNYVQRMELFKRVHKQLLISEEAMLRK